MTEKSKTAQLRLAGRDKIISRDDRPADLLDFYGRAFERLKDAARETGQLCRLVAFQSVAEQAQFHFLGLDIGADDAPAADLTFWALDNEWRTVNEDTHGIAWGWRNAANGMVTGDFSVQDEAEFKEFFISGNAFFNPKNEQPGADKIELTEYNPAWPEMFAECAAQLKQELGAAALRIEHYGSTAIPGMSAKPIIDVLVEIDSFAAARKLAIPLFNHPEWEYWWHSGHMVFVRRDAVTGSRSRHVHLAPSGHDVWQGLAFRDYLRTHPADAARYARLKQKLAANCGNNRELYTISKTELVRELTGKAIDSA